ncbi:DUF2480 family protein [Aquimarina brevivitae]|uniref:Uncharacterized protein DUF2480 n=1 Tax=Aquimarina brevivitae TaxID=323412 RepID=A0A4Q7PHE6_9FLAO|nr:DUF2480 family protein [Aquimarina brevivitae]RZS99358.1 uncharacterized protein DUF2480 [Aquimarina brevivitae]
MADEIINRVANNQNLVTLDLEDFYPEGKRVVFDIKDWLFQELILKEKEFRAHVKNHDWSQYQDQYVVLTCSTDAIIPGWAYLLLTTTLQPYAKKVCTGSVELLNALLYEEIITKLDVAPYENKSVIIKGCAEKPVPESAFLSLIQKLQPIAKTIMYGEACSSVPLYKRK